MLTNILTLGVKQKSITQTLSPTYRKISGIKAPLQKLKTEVTIQTIREEYSHVNDSIDNLQNALNHRMDTHEKQLLNIMKIQISKVLEDVRKIVKVFNLMIKEKNFSQDLWETKNQVDYFKYQAIRLFQQNKSLKRQIVVLKQQIQSLTFQQKCQSIALKRVTKKLIKEKSKRNAISMHQIAQNKSVNNQQQKMTQAHRKRHESLSTNLPKFVKKDESSENKELKTLKSNNQSTLSKSQLQKQKIKTDNQLQSAYYSPKLPGFSQRVKLLCNNGRSQKIKFLRQRESFSKNNQNQKQQAKQQTKQQNNELIKILNGNY